MNSSSPEELIITYDREPHFHSKLLELFIAPYNVLFADGDITSVSEAKLSELISRDNEIRHEQDLIEKTMGK